MGYGLAGLLIQSQAQALANVDVAHVAAGVHFDGQYHHALVFGLARFFGKFRLDFVDQLRRRDTGCAMNAESWRSGSRVADALAAAVIADAVVAVVPERATGQVTVGIADVRAGVD